MKLPEPARQAWRQHCKALLRIAGEKAGGRLLIGGGTILASRWGHRLSEDIDVLLPDRQVVSDTHPGGPNDLARLTGGQVEGKWRDRIKVRVEHGLLDVCAMQPQLRGLEQETTVEGETAAVLSTAQILRGKLNRTHHGLARDAFDLVAAAKADPRALQHAVNALDKVETDLVLNNLQHANKDIADSADEALHGVAKTFETDMKRLGINAAQAVDDSRYTRVRITLEREKVHIDRWTASGRQPPETYPSDHVAEALLESGIGEYLKVNHLTHETMAGQGIAELIRQQRQGPIFDTANTNPVSEIREGAETVLRREEEELSERRKSDPGSGPENGAPDEPAEAAGAESGKNPSWKNKSGTVVTVGDGPRRSPGRATGTAEATQRQKPDRTTPQKQQASSAATDSPHAIDRSGS